MKTINRTEMPAAVMAEMQEAVARAVKGIRDPERVKCARQSMDRIREDIRRDHGVVDIGVPAIRELRDRLAPLP